MPSLRVAVLAYLGCLGCLVVASCRKDGFIAPPKAGGDITQNVGSFDAAPRSHLLLFPLATAEALLGRAVILSEDGGWTIADERAPGCEVRVERIPAEYTKQYRVALEDLTSLAAGYSALLGLQAEYGRSIEAEIVIDNTEIMRADIRGPCGDVIVDSVSVGRGERKLLRRAAASVEGRGGQGPVGVSAGRGSEAEVKDRIHWQTPQAYAFTYRELSKVEPLHIDVDMPRSITDGDALEIRLAGSRDAHVVVFFLEENGAGGVLWPAEGQTAKITAGQPTVLGPLEAHLRTPTEASIETLVIYAFADEHDYRQFKPDTGAYLTDGTAYAASLTEKLSTISLSRWSRVTLSYQIVPR
jgi:hypothetical protein